MYKGSRQNSSDIYTEEQVKRVVTGCGITIQSEMDGDVMVFCPYHNNFRTPSAEINKHSGIFFCFSCQQTATLIEFVMYVTQRTYFESVRFIKSKEKDIDIEYVINKKLQAVPEYISYDEVTIERLNQQALISERAVSYFKMRLINEQSIKKFKLGYSEKQDMVTVPVHAPNGLCLGFVGRSVDGKIFKNTPGLPKSKTLFNVHRIKTSSTVYVVESSFDAIRLDQVGFPAVATLGANVSGKQIELLQQYFNNIIIIADNDEAGGNMSERITDKLKSRVSIVKLDKQYKDIGDMQDEDIVKLQYQFDNSISAMLQ
jgi:DNA primase